MKIFILAVSVGILIGLYKGYYLKGRENKQLLAAIISADKKGNTEKNKSLTESIENTVRNEVRIININTAGKVDLESIPGVGPVTADRIIEFRKINGRIRNLKHLQDVKGIGPKTVKKIEPFVIF